MQKWDTMQFVLKQHAMLGVKDDTSCSHSKITAATTTIFSGSFSASRIFSGGFSANAENIRLGS